MLAWYRDLIALRRTRSELTDRRLDRVRVDHDADAQWIVLHRGGVRVAANLAEGPRTVPLGGDAGEILLAFGPAEAAGGTVRLGAESVAVVTVRE
jgi:maltooligosyltrehalose trehalohydrolase